MAHASHDTHATEPAWVCIVVLAAEYIVRSDHGNRYVVLVVCC